jgi:DNA-directed RNA polymerase specialized sigma24 family protein
MTVTESEWDARAGERDSAANGDQAAWTALFVWLWPWTVQLAGSTDGAMAGWLKVVRNPRLWLKPLRFFAAIFNNAGRDEARMERRHQRRIAALWAAGGAGVQHASDAELMAIIKQALGKLLPNDQRVTALYVEGYSIKDISGKCGVAYSTVRRRSRIALAALRDVLRRESGEGGLSAPAVQARQISNNTIAEINDEESKNN